MQKQFRRFYATSPFELLVKEVLLPSPKSVMFKPSNNYCWSFSVFEGNLFTPQVKFVFNEQYFFAQLNEFLNS